MSNLYGQLSDLYKLHRAAVELEHGIKSSGWKLYEPSKFIYAFFAFNNFYSINWEQSQNQKELINWELKEMSEAKKIKEMQKYIFRYHVCDKLNKNDLENAKKELGGKFTLKVNEYLGSSLKDKAPVLHDIVLDSRINQKEKDTFIKSITKLVNEGTLSNKTWDSMLRFIYLVRNNVFHGSKDITQMSGANQIDRFKIYTAILLATNEMLFELIESTFQWINEERGRITSIERNQIREPLKVKFSLDETLGSRYKIQIPDGLLFYPCCGDDTSEPIKFFIDTISEFHFVDVSFIPRLPILECDPKRYRLNERPYQLEEISVIPQTIIERIGVEGSESSPVDEKILEEIRELGIESVGYRKLTKTKKEEWIYALEKGRKIEIFRHLQDGLIKLMELDKIAVFFLRGDSLGESGSGQKWFQPKLFDLVIEKLVDGGYIVTDGSGLDYKTSDYVPWKKFWEREGDSWDNDLKRPKDFYYKNRKFTCIGECGNRYGTVYLWKVDKFL